MNRNDKRYIQTENLILNIFAELINEKGFGKVTVKDITGRSKISRGAFYLHYEDKYDLLDHCEKSIVNDLKLISSEMLNISHGSDIQDLKHFFTKIIYYYKKNASIVSSLILNSPNSELQKWLKNQVGYNVLNSYYNITGSDKLPISIEYLSSYLYYGHLGILSQWFYSGMKETPEEIADIIIELSFKPVLNSLTTIP